MKFEKQITNIKFVMTKEELPYTEVLNDFENAEYIYVLTYNISQRQIQLIDRLQKCEDAVICIVTNIPGRWEQYFGDIYAEKARRNINLYKSRLDLSHSDLSVYFNFSNHAKIIMTENVVYVGSANYSEESANNFEVGFVSHDANFINFLRDEIFLWIIDSSVELKTDNELLFIEMGLTNAIIGFQSLYEDIHYCFYTYSGHSTSSAIKYYRGNNESFSDKDVETIIDCFEKYIDLIERANRVLILMHLLKEMLQILMMFLSESTILR